MSLGAIARRGAVGLAAAAVTCLAATPALAEGPQAGAAAVGAAPVARQIRLVFPLQADLAGLGRLALAVSSPGSPAYGRYQSIAALARRFGASRVVRRRVVGYLRHEGARSVAVDATGLFAEATFSVGLAEHLFAVPLARYRTASDTYFVAPTEAATVPPALSGLVTGVVGLDTRLLAAAAPPIGARGVVRARAAAAASQPTSGYEPASGTQSGCQAGEATQGFTPNQYLTAYDYARLHEAGIRGQGERVALIEIDGFRRSDIVTFARCFGLDVPRIDSFGVGLTKPLDPGGESTLDLEVLDAAAPDLSAADVYETRPDALDILTALAAPLHNPGFEPQVISASLGLCEPEAAISLGRPGLDTAEAELAMAAASGVSFLASTGDDGSAACTDSSGVPLDALAVSFPASSPWVTSVGGTNLMLGPSNAIASEVVWNDTFDPPGSAGGGGASILFRRPAYQLGTVRGNRRTVPDVAMLADVAPGYAFYCSASACVAGSQPPWQSVGGTSAATPLLAGGLALVDQQLRDAGRAQLGLANPLLYALGRSRADSTKVFYDVLAFGNDVGQYIPGNGAALGCCAAGPGYDEASGWGSVDLANFAALATQLEPRLARIGLALPRGQRPISRRLILATVSCSAPCSLAADAEVTVGSTPSFSVASGSYRLDSPGERTIPLRFSPAQLRSMRAALGGGKHIVAGVFAMVLGPSGEVERTTATQRLEITG